MKPDDTNAKLSPQEAEEQPAIQKLQLGLDQLDRQFPAFTPNLQWFEQQVEQEKRRLRSRFLRDLALFWIAALLLMSISYMVLTHQPNIFVIVQAAAMLGPALWLAYRKLVDRHERA